MKIDFLDGSEQKAIQYWHNGLEENRGDRARLRRAERAEDVLLSNAFFCFLRAMPSGDFPVKLPENMKLFAGAAVVGLLSHVKKHRPDGRFAEQLAKSVDGKNDKPPMSKLRFQQLQKSHTTDDFYRHIVRAIRILDGKVNIVSLAGDILHWHWELNNQFDRNPSNCLAVRWATDYFTVLLKKNNK